MWEGPLQEGGITPVCETPALHTSILSFAYSLREVVFWWRRREFICVDLFPVYRGCAGCVAGSREEA